MTRQRLHLLIDGALFAAAWLLLATGLLMAFVLPPRSGGASVWGLSRHDWGTVHFVAAIAATAVLLVHLALNWGWVCSVVGKLCGTGATRRGRLITGALALTVLVVGTAAFLIAAEASLEAPARMGRGLHAAIAP